MSLASLFPQPCRRPAAVLCLLVAIGLTGGCDTAPSADDIAAPDASDGVQFASYNTAQVAPQHDEDEVQLRDDLAIATRTGEQPSVMIAIESGRATLTPAEAQRLAMALHRAAFDISDEETQRGIIGPSPEPEPRCDPGPDRALFATPGGYFSPCPPPMFNLTREQTGFLYIPDAFMGDTKAIEDARRVPGGHVLPPEALR